MQSAATNHTEPMLRLRDVTARAGGRNLMTGLDLTVAAGELVAVTGPSGCGKTTLLRTISGLQAGVGTVTLRGENPDQLGWPYFRRQVILVDQQPVLLAGTVGENLRRPFTYKRMTAEFDTDRARRLLAGTGLAAIDFGSDARALSVGQQQRICLVRAMLLDPAILLLDEPTASLDETAVAQTEALIASQVQAQDGGALIVTHDTQQAERWCHRRIDLTRYLTASETAPEVEAGS